MRVRPLALSIAISIGLSATELASSARAQPAVAPAAPLPTPAPTAAPQAPPSVLPPDMLASGLAPIPGGLTADEVARTAARTRASVRARQAELRAAAARVDQALVAFFPRATLTAGYTRVSFVNNTFPGALAATLNTPPPGTPAFPKVGACPPGVAGQCVVDQKGSPLVLEPLAIPLIQDQYSVTGSIVVPITDYVLRLSQGYAAASHNETAKRLSVDAEALAVGADGKLVFYNWVRSRGGVVVAKQSMEAARAHVLDAKRVFDAGLLSKADVLRLEAQVATAEQVVAETEALEAVAAEQLRIVLSVPPDRPLSIGTDVLHETPPQTEGDLAQLSTMALQRRLEVRALDETAYSLKKAENAAASGYFPRVDAFADGQYADPNPRYFLQQDVWKFTWDAGVRATWTINDTFTALGQTAEARAQTRSVIEQRAMLRDGLRMEVANALADMRRAAASIDAADRGLLASEESLRVRRELFRNGKATSVDLIDAEAEATRARLSRLDARIGVLVARARLEHATGRDVPISGPRTE